MTLCASRSAWETRFRSNVKRSTRARALRYGTPESLRGDLGIVGRRLRIALRDRASRLPVAADERDTDLDVAGGVRDVVEEDARVSVRGRRDVADARPRRAREHHAHVARDVQPHERRRRQDQGRHARGAQVVDAIAAPPIC
jgi:hypothetical protein